MIVNHNRWPSLSIRLLKDHANFVFKIYSDFAPEDGFQESIHDNVHGALHGDSHGGAPDGDPTPRPHANEAWRLTPSMLDPDSYTFTTFANQPPGYYTPTPGGTSTLYHSQAGDLHAPSYTFGLGTPLSLPTSEGGVSASQIPTTATVSANTALSSFPQPAVASHHFHNPEPFAIHIPSHQGFMDPTYSQQVPGIDHVDHMPQSAPAIGDMQIDMDIPEHSPLLSFQRPGFDAAGIRPASMYQHVER